MRLYAPHGYVGSVSIDGESIAVENGAVEVPDHLAATLVESHGFSGTPPAGDDPNSEPNTDIATMTRAELFASLKALGVGLKLPRSNDELREALRAKLAENAAAVEVAQQAEAERAAAEAAEVKRLAEEEATRIAAAKAEAARQAAEAQRLATEQGVAEQAAGAAQMAQDAPAAAPQSEAQETAHATPVPPLGDPAPVSQPADPQA